jgi:hypothetical protein
LSFCDSTTEKLLREDERPNGVLPALAGHGLDEIAGGEEHEVVILPPLPKIGRRREVGQAADELLAGSGLVVVPDEVVTRQPRAMRDEIAGRQPLPRLGVVEAEPGDVVADGLVPLHFALVDERPERECGERLGRGADGHEGVGRHRQLAFDVAEAEALGQDDLLVLDDSDGRAGDLEGSQSLGDDLVEALERLLRLGSRILAPFELERESAASLGELACDRGPVGT